LFGTLAQRLHATVVRERYGKYGHHISDQHHNPNAPMKWTKYRPIPIMTTVQTSDTCNFNVKSLPNNVTINKTLN